MENGTTILFGLPGVAVQRVERAADERRRGGAVSACGDHGVAARRAARSAGWCRCR